MTQARPDNGQQGIERMPPQAVEVEQAVIGAMMIDPGAIGRAIELLDETCFYHSPHNTIFKAILSLYERSEAVDQLTLAEELKRRNSLDQVGGVVYLAKLASEVATAANIEYHAQIVLDKALGRKLIETSAEVSKQAYEGSQDVQELIDWAEQQIFSLSEDRLNQGFEPLEHVMSETLEQIERAHNRVSTVSGVETGFSELNESTSGFQRGDLIILAARPSVGKTALALTLSRNAAVEAGVGVAVFSLEMSKVQLAQRLLSAETKVDLHKLRTGRLRDEDWVHLTRNVGRLAQAPIYIDDTPGITVLEARAKARRLKREHGIGMVVIDYLQLMSSHGRADSREQEISRISRGLKGLAKELDLPVLALSQLSRAVESRTDRRPQLSDLRESGCLTGDTLVPRADTGERVQMRSLLDSPNAKIWALNRATGKLEKVAVSNAFCTGIKPVFRLTTRLGRTIRATGNHKFLTVEGWKRLDELGRREHIALPRLLKSSQRQTMTDAELALLGHLIGDGCVLPRHSVQYTTQDVNLANEVASHAKEIFGDKIRPHTQKVIQKSRKPLFQLFLSATESLTRGRRNSVGSWFTDLGIFGRRAWEKRVPEKIFEQPARAIAVFLRHIWATDGAIKMTAMKGRRDLPRIYYASSSEGLARDIQSLLLRIGINARIVLVSQGTKGRDQFHVVISGKPDIQRFIDDIGTVKSYRSAEISQIRANLALRKHNTNRDVIPRSAWHLIVKPDMGLNGISAREMQSRLGNEYCGTSLYKAHMSREKADRVAQAVNSETMAILADSDIYWDEIASIVPDGKEEVFDLTVPEHHNFVADDIIVHNSIEQDADVVMFIYRPEIYGLKAPDGGSLEGIAEIIIGKQRNGPTGSVHMMWNAESATYEQMAPEWRMDQEDEDF